MTYINNGTKNRRLCDLYLGPFGIFLEAYGVLQSPVRIILPEIDAVTQPVVVIRAWMQFVVAINYSAADRYVTAMKTEDEKR